MTEQEYFTVHHALTINVEPLAADYDLPSPTDFEAEIPAPFVVASEFSQLDQLSEAARLELKNSDFKNVIQLLETQNSKLNLLLSFMLSQQDDSRFRTHTTGFGASQFTYKSPQAVNPGHLVRAKLFLEYPAAAIYCYGQIVTCEPADDHFMATVKYTLLRDTDQDLLIKAALHQQQKLLRQRSLDREKS
ncbi:MULTISPECIES: PilZ domain-containing protein [Vibrio]|uniref:PilZ domain-containing protein n=1 Tax=Vibrio ostreae TaxID=2841925 RepID=A0A975UEJ7_9VIBR|nr:MULTISPECIES: PilZ domain-containing protein [Vibrio]QXO19094.1 PilZ domain-containing protein [Vibrio ostreae]WGY46559.1 PilZ domain-containing protein [Vibrio sp. ABG19]